MPPKKHVLRIDGDALGNPTPFDGQWITEYDPSRLGIAPDGRPLLCHLRTTRIISRAKMFDTAGEAIMFFRRDYGLRTDGKPNRPLTAFNIWVETFPPEFPSGVIGRAPVRDWDPRPEPGPGVCPRCGSGRIERIGTREYCAQCGK